MHINRSPKPPTPLYTPPHLEEIKRATGGLNVSKEGEEKQRAEKLKGLEAWIDKTVSSNPETKKGLEKTLQSKKPGEQSLATAGPVKYKSPVTEYPIGESQVVPHGETSGNNPVIPYAGRLYQVVADGKPSQLQNPVVAYPGEGFMVVRDVGPNMSRPRSTSDPAGHGSESDISTNIFYGPQNQDFEIRSNSQPLSAPSVELEPEISSVHDFKVGDTVRPGYPMHNRTNREAIGNAPKSVNRFWDLAPMISSGESASPLESKLKQMLAQDHAAARSPARFVAIYKPEEGPEGGSLKKQEFKGLADGAPMSALGQEEKRGLFVFGDRNKELPESQDFKDARERYTTKGQLTYFQGANNQLQFVHPDASPGRALIGKSWITPITT